MTPSDDVPHGSPGSRQGLAGLLHEDTTIVGLECADALQAIEALGKLLKDQGFVEDGYVEDVIARERTFPTGLPSDPYPVALPHADPDHVVRTGLALAILKEPVAFAEMGSDGSRSVNVRIVLMMAIKEQKNQVELLRTIVQALQSPDMLAKLIAAKQPAEAVRTFKSIT